MTSIFNNNIFNIIKEETDRYTIRAHRIAKIYSTLISNRDIIYFSFIAD